MKTVAGLWVDHREAVIVILSDKGQETTEGQISRKVRQHYLPASACRPRDRGSRR